MRTWVSATASAAVAGAIRDESSARAMIRCMVVPSKGNCSSVSAQPRHRYVRFELPGRAHDAAFETALGTKAERFVELARPDVAFRGDELDAVDGGPRPPHFVDQGFEKRTPDAATLRIRVHSGGQ